MRGIRVCQIYDKLNIYEKYLRDMSNNLRTIIITKSCVNMRFINYKKIYCVNTILGDNKNWIISKYYYKSLRITKKYVGLNNDNKSLGSHIKEFED